MIVNAEGKDEENLYLFLIFVYKIKINTPKENAYKHLRGPLALLMPYLFNK